MKVTPLKHDQIIDDYYGDNVITIKQVAQKHSISMQAVKYHLTKEGRGQKQRVNPGKPVMPIRDEVIEYYMNNMNESLQSIADRFGIAKYTVSNWVSQYLKFLTT